MKSLRIAHSGVVALAVAALMAGCASGVKLDEKPTPVETRTPTAVTPSTNANAGTPAPQSQVTSVDLTKKAPESMEDLPHVYFDFDSYTIKPEFQSLIDGHARFLKANPQRRVSIEGHTDERGGREYNLALGQKRSEAVRRALVLLGVSDNQIEAVSFGKEKPAVQGTGEDVWAQNRRAEITYRR
jgi:peptidoglycan-associated lipoprotein